MRETTPTGAIHLTEVLQSIRRAEEYHQTVNLKAWKLSSGDIVDYSGWLVIGSHYRGGTTRLKNPANNLVRLVRNCTIFEYMGKTVYW